MATPPERLTRELVVIGPFPPPHNGAAKNTRIWAQDFATAGFRVTRIGTNVSSGSAHNRSVRYHWDRMRAAAGNARQLRRVLHRDCIVYIVPDGGLGLIYSLIYAVLLRLRGVPRVWMHHRNFRNIRTGSILLRSFCKAVGPAGRNIFLTQGMQAMFEVRIGAAPGCQIIGNAATCDVTVPAAPRVFEPGRLTAGFLSNLNADKGFDIAVRSFQMLAAASPGMRFLVGGSPSDAQAADWAASLQRALGDRVQFLGHVSGEQKTAFFQSLDIFVFPTRYKLEAQPNVLMEALAAGAAVVATEHACIPETLSGTHHRLVRLQDPVDMADDLSNAVLDLEQEMNSADRREEISGHNIAAFKSMQAESCKAYRRFLQSGVKE